MWQLFISSISFKNIKNLYPVHAVLKSKPHHLPHEKCLCA